MKTQILKFTNGVPSIETVEMTEDMILEAKKYDDDKREKRMTKLQKQLIEEHKKEDAEMEAGKRAIRFTYFGK